MVPHPSLLIVDEQEETREVLRAVFEPRGVHILQADRPEQGLRLVREHAPDLIVLDLEVDPACSDNLVDRFDRESHCAPLVVLGSMRLPNGRASHDGYLTKPYHYGSLIRKIESLLEQAKTSSTGS